MKIVEIAERILNCRKELEPYDIESKLTTHKEIGIEVVEDNEVLEKLRELLNQGNSIDILASATDLSNGSIIVSLNLKRPTGVDIDAYYGTDFEFDVYPTRPDYLRCISSKIKFYTCARTHTDVLENIETLDNYVIYGVVDGDTLNYINLLVRENINNNVTYHWVIKDNQLSISNLLGLCEDIALIIINKIVIFSSNINELQEILFNNLNETISDKDRSRLQTYIIMFEERDFDYLEDGTESVADWCDKIDRERNKGTICPNTDDVVIITNCLPFDKSLKDCIKVMDALGGIQFYDSQHNAELSFTQHKALQMLYAEGYTNLSVLSQASENSIGSLLWVLEITRPIGLSKKDFWGIESSEIVDTFSEDLDFICSRIIDKNGVRYIEYVVENSKSLTNYTLTLKVCNDTVNSAELFINTATDRHYIYLQNNVRLPFSRYAKLNVQKKNQKEIIPFICTVIKREAKETANQMALRCKKYLQEGKARKNVLEASKVIYQYITGETE
ncbi:hypothetical protein SAMN02745136_00454 [Anaerocolumna jejuensis DSM 15929]|uniref:Uncharacterized protein n=1 Tax=Anaerocolumna jejuensis DSM 15929 TaxID=1121322 RepID=A0A1M6KHE2_9FIRM|nr:hypothetical protein [Anaerocolumna jejuensis]SHJ58374.1 hypothetical protein SAMN02745136_00454 [Anaerocolumna jejuensis DSM 15929]